MNKVYVGLSGGVDSSVSALLLKQAGYDVIGVFIKIWHPDFLNCNWKEEMRDAMRICAKLDIPFIKIDLSKQYEDFVIKYMVDEYSKGRTPNPDVMCNSFIKFGEFYKWAMESGADFIATGHYAQIEDDCLAKAVDQDKDQTYFLWKIKKEQLKNILFPIGHLEKKQVREIAEKNGLITASKKDSQGLCFVGDVNMKDFLKKYIKTEKGDVLNEKGEKIGIHDGTVLFTIGERHGFTITEKEIDESPYYIVSKDLNKNTITVSKNKPESENTTIEISDINLFKTLPKQLDSKIRYRQEFIETEIVSIDDAKIEVKFLEKAGSITKGQSIVFYKDNLCLGGGIIE